MSDYEYEKVDPGALIEVTDRELRPRLLNMPPSITEEPVFQVLPLDERTRLPALPPDFSAGLPAENILFQFIGRLPGRGADDIDGLPLIGLFARAPGGTFLLAIAKSPFCYDIVLN